MRYILLFIRSKCRNYFHEEMTVTSKGQEGVIPPCVEKENRTTQTPISWWLWAQFPLPKRGNDNSGQFTEQISNKKSHVFLFVSLFEPSWSTQRSTGDSQKTGCSPGPLLVTTGCLLSPEELT